MINNQKPPYNPTQPIPNTSGSYPESYYIESPQGTVFLGSGLELNPETGTLSSGGGVSGVPLESTIYSLAVLPNGVVLAGGDSGTVFRSTDNGATWDSGTFLDEGNFNAPVYSLVSVGEGKVLASTPNLSYLLLTEDSGQTWTEGYDFGDGIHAVGYNNFDRSVWVSPEGFYVWKSFDLENWTSYSTGLGTTYGFTFPSPSRIVVNPYYYWIIYSDDGGETWSYSEGGNFAGSGTSLVSGSEGHVLGYFLFDGGMYLSSDNGESWNYNNNIGGAEKVPYIAYNNGVFYAGTDYLGRVYKSLDGGLNWQVFYDPSSINATSRAISFSNDDKILVAINNFVLRVPTTYTPPAPPAPALCTLAYPTVPPTEPPYNCITNVNTSGVTSFSEAWYNCEYIVKFPCVDSSAVTDFNYAWAYCYNLALFPQIDTSSGQDFTYSWAHTRIDRFPPIDTSSATTFEGTWAGCYYLEDFPLIEAGSVTEFYYTWAYCEGLKDFPLIDTSSGENFSYTWYGCYSLISFPVLNVSNGTNFDQSWANCTSLTNFPTLDVSSGVHFNGAWSNCKSLTSFPDTLDLGSGNGFGNTWAGCTGLTSFPGTLDLSSGDSFGGAWAGCTGLTSFPGTLDLSSGVNFNESWRECTGLTSFPGTLDLSSGTNFFFTWGYCTGLTSFPGLDLSSGINFSLTWYGCTGLTSFPGTINLSSGTNFYAVWGGCTGLTSFPALDLSSATSLNQSWISCTSLTSFPTIDTPSVRFFSETWAGCTGLVSFPALNFSSVVNSPYGISNSPLYRTWAGCSSLTTFPAGVFNSCFCTQFFLTWVGCALSQQSVDNILVSLNTAGQSNGIVNLDGGTSSAPSSTGLAAKASLQSRGWTVITN